MAPQDKQIHMLLAKYQLSRGNFAEAETNLNAGMMPDDVEGYLVKSQVLMGMNKPEEAATALEEAIASGPANAEVQGNLGSIYLKLGRTDDAEKHLQEAIRLDPNFSDAYYALAQIWDKRGDHAIARMYLNRARR